MLSVCCLTGAIVFFILGGGGGCPVPDATSRWAVKPTRSGGWHVGLWNLPPSLEVAGHLDPSRPQNSTSPSRGLTLLEVRAKAVPKRSCEGHVTRSSSRH